MKIQQTSFYERINLLDTEEKQTVLKNMKDVQKHLLMTDAIAVEISDEGVKALRERVNELQPETDYTDPREMKRVETNEVEFDYYMTMRQMSIRGGYDTAEEAMKSIMESYETLYNQIVDAHKDGDRLVSYEIMGDKTLTLEEDLAELDKAFERQVGDLEGLIVRTQTRSILWLAHRNSPQSPQNPQGKVRRYDGWYNYSEKEYADVAVAMMKLARENFWALFDSKNYQKGDGKRIISDIINKNADFLADTKKLFSKY
ncbi:MAG: hypothetical protein K2J99_07035 [Lachnospiraceae bacterium]|nr:hypothetical protein [Lachnospiraceae bacterium]